ncbi:hypothetical protein OPKNFCMD_2461 [Methylobacterium crusticola]|uniref:Spermidine synthase n=1 Tax=Methylobacterium crusticola TaxID=1697972 RepID=A0ABQ4QWT9_9HYPH|nr:fused MFS/spermidine synthase [Methylobacterium crusticola]GJD49728.1 hypothetical protein OPKNFCMD_2461 [Methylobacterium crusticola]
MTSAIRSLDQPAPAGARSRGAGLLLPLFAATLFLSAFLLFAVQPMFTKMVLPALGGTPAVWSVAMVFFQSLLLAGYLYAHWLVRRVPFRVAAALHGVLMVGAVAAMPIVLAAGWGRPPAEGQALWLLGLFATSVGLPFFAVAGNGPLLQAWFARSGHPAADNPYALYAASNLGSFAALLAYPAAFEPLLALRDQSRAWMIGFLVLAAMIAACAVLTGRREPAAALPARARAEARPTWRSRLAWIALSFVPSGLLVSVTAHIATDVASAPLLWVVPLALFLLTFVLAFRDRPPVGDALLTRLQVGGTALACLALVTPSWGLAAGLGLHLGLFFVTTMVCHAALYRSRPPASRLTEFYLCMSLGGVLGGIACTLVAPQVFSSVVEYPVLLVLALACRPGFFADLRAAGAREAGRTLARCAVAVAACAGLALLLDVLAATRLMLVAAFALMLTLTWSRPRLLAPVALVLLLLIVVFPKSHAVRLAHRSFFGVHQVADTQDGRFRVLVHGTTVHGAVRLRNEDGTPATGRPEPLTYYVPDGAYAGAVGAVRAARGGTLPAVGVIGLGAGLLACYAAPGEAWTFLEIDPVIAAIARNPEHFQFLSACAPAAPIVLGDGRLTLADQPGGLSLLVLDAFSSDAIPTHLLTREALGLYFAKLDPRGALVLNITNRHLDVRRILARTAAEHGLVTYVLKEAIDEPVERRMRYRTTIAAVAREPAHLGALASGGVWQRIEPDPAVAPWTDDYSNLLQAIADHALRE